MSERNPERIRPQRRTSIASYVVASWLMRDMAPLLTDISFESKPNASAKKFINLMGDEEYCLARQAVQRVVPDGNQHIAMQQMDLTSKTHHDRFRNKRVIAKPDFLVATHWLEKGPYGEKLEAELGIGELIADKIPEARPFYLDIATRTVVAQAASTDLRILVSNARHDVEFWLSN